MAAHTVGTVEVESLDQFDRLRSASRSMAGWFVQDLDLRERSESLLSADPHGAVFLGCEMAPAVEDRLRGRGAVLFPELPGLPFDPYRARLYTATELYGDVAGGGAYADSVDARSNLRGAAVTVPARLLPGHRARWQQPKPVPAAGDERASGAAPMTRTVGENAHGLTA